MFPETLPTYAWFNSPVYSLRKEADAEPGTVQGWARGDVKDWVRDEEGEDSSRLWIYLES